MLSIIVLRKKIGIGKNRYRAGQTSQKKRKSAKKIAIGASLIIIIIYIYMVFRHLSRQEVLINKQILLEHFCTVMVINRYHLPKPILCDSLSKKKKKKTKWSNVFI